MKLSLAGLALAALVSGGAMVGAAAPANAGLVIRANVGPEFYGYRYDRPCRYYFKHDLPAPARCRDDYARFYHTSVYVDGGFVFRDHDTWVRWHDRDDYHHWHDHWH
jgi:hypothetical protein